VVTSLVVDDQFDEVELTNETMDQVRQAVAGAVGYVEGRDKIHISKASFLPKRVQQIAVEEDVKSEIVLPKDTVLDKLTRLGRLWPIFAIGCVITSGILVVLLFIKTVFEKLFQIISVIPTLFKRQKKDEPMDDEIVELNDPMVEEDIVLTEQDVINSLKTKSDFAKVIQLKALSTQELEVVVDELKELIKG
jgi:hypothetical protein